MFEGIKKKIAHYILRKKYLRKDIKPTAFNGIISSAHNFFILMPKDEKDFYHSLDILKYYLIHKKNITLFLPEHRRALIPENDKYKTVVFQSELKRRFNLPEKKLVDTLLGREFEVVIDLNRGEEVFFSTVANIVKSKIRIGFAKELSDRYYNIEIAEKQSNPEVAYRNYLNYLKMF
ncbi:MAG: hypothetical protein CVV24_01110 [Ignavibacteriae bacterium HGW-Ignavibacteriae-3]|nr:MAG: hypothetical protein CVV24_01110 [Ignavibacteriae bacterium HGW-Ignavibacteriae-3]